MFRSDPAEQLTWLGREAAPVAAPHPDPLVMPEACFQVRLDKRFVIEVDGGHHSEPQQIAHDIRRTRWLEEAGYIVLRVSNTDVFENLDGVCGTILGELSLRSSFARTRRNERK